MSTADQVARAYALLMGIGGLGLGQLMAGQFSLGAGLAGLAGAVAGALAGRHLPPLQDQAYAKVAAFRARGLLLCGLLAALGVLLDAVRQASLPELAGQSYPWVLMLPYLAALAWLAVRAVQALP